MSVPSKPASNRSPDRFAEVVAKLEAVAAARRDREVQCAKWNKYLWENLQDTIRSRADRYSAALNSLIYKHYLVTQSVEPKYINRFTTRVMLLVADEHNDMMHPEISLLFSVSRQAELQAVATGVLFEKRVIGFESAVLETQVTAAIDDFTEAAMLTILADPEDGKVIGA